MLRHTFLLPVQVVSAHIVCRHGTIGFPADCLGSGSSVSPNPELNRWWVVSPGTPGEDVEVVGRRW